MKINTRRAISVLFAGFSLLALSACEQTPEKPFSDKIPPPPNILQNPTPQPPQGSESGSPAHHRELLMELPARPDQAQPASVATTPESAN